MYTILFFFFNDTPHTENYTYLHTLSLHDALPIWIMHRFVKDRCLPGSMTESIVSAWSKRRPMSLRRSPTSKTPARASDQARRKWPGRKQPCKMHRPSLHGRRPT